MPAVVQHGPFRKVLVRYFLDRDGASAESSTAVFWESPPEVATATDVKNYLHRVGITRHGMIAQVYLQQYQAYMNLDAIDGTVTFDFKQPNEILSLRLTSTSCGDEHDKPAVPEFIARSTTCNMSPLGLFAFSMLICLHTVEDFMSLNSDIIVESYKALWACYAFWIGGFLQLWVGGFEAVRGNVYGATAFSAFGCFWLANGTLKILKTFFNLPAGPEYQEPTKIGGDIKDFWILIFVFVLFKQTLIMNRVSTAITVVLSFWIIASMISVFSEPFIYVKVVSGALLCSVGFYGFTAELTNEVYPEEPMPMWPVHQGNEEIFGAAGRSRTLKRSLIDLRTATGRQQYKGYDEEA